MKRQNTRERILLTCRKLFNGSGVAAVTTAAIAEAAGINEGNLYYYFKKKADIVSELFEQFAAEQLRVASQQDDLHLWFQLMWEWRFFYRDSMTLFGLDPSLRPRLQTLSDAVQAHGRAKLLAMIGSGRMNLREEQIEALLENAWIVSTYWIEYLHSRHGIVRVTRKHLNWGYNQMAALFEPYLVRSRDVRAATGEQAG